MRIHNLPLREARSLILPGGRAEVQSSTDVSGTIEVPTRFVPGSSRSIVLGQFRARWRPTQASQVQDILRNKLAAILDQVPHRTILGMGNGAGPASGWAFDHGQLAAS